MGLQSMYFCFSAAVAVLVNLDTSYGCMVERNVGTTFLFNNKCYWTILPIEFTTWQSAKAVCGENDGVLATINSESLNNFTATRINR